MPLMTTMLRLATACAVLALACQAGSAGAQTAAATQVIPRSGSAPDKLPENFRPIEASPDMPTSTEVRSPEEAKLLLGHRPLVWKRLGEARTTKPGAVEVVDQGGLWRIKGVQKGAEPGAEKDSVTIDGVILRILPNMFTIKGEVATRSAKVMNGVACKQSGTVTFKRHPRDPFWRLLDNENPCTGEREVIELRMDAPPPRPQAQKAQKRT
jgi:hypothetical protein